MRFSRGLLCLSVLIALIVGGCEKQQGGPLPLEVLPGMALNDRATPIVVRGERFNASVVASYDDEKESFVDARFQIRLGEYALQDVRWVGPTELTGKVPAGVAEGKYDLVVIDPRGRSGTLEQAFDVWEPQNLPVDMGIDLGPDGPPPDATVDLPYPDAVFPDLGLLPDIGACPPICVNNCTGGYCEVDCTAGCTCPVGIPCRTSCDDTGCTGTIDCSGATRCDVTCTGADTGCDGSIVCPSDGDCLVRAWGTHAYEGDIQCGTGSCRVFCLGFNQQTCTGSVYCTLSCACSVAGFSGTVSCPSACNQQCGFFDDCDNC